MIPLWLLGSGGHAKVVIDTVRENGQYLIQGLLDDDKDIFGSYVLDFPVKGDISPESIERFAISNAVIAIGSNRARADIAQRFHKIVNWVAIVHPKAYVAASARIGKGTVVFAGAVVQPDTRMGEHVIVNTASSIDHDGRIDNFAHIAPGVHLSGNVHVKEGALLGVGAIITPGKTIGAWSTVGAGAVVIRDVQDKTMVVGVPAKPLRKYLES